MVKALNLNGSKSFQKNSKSMHGKGYDISVTSSHTSNERNIKGRYSLETFSTTYY